MIFDINKECLRKSYRNPHLPPRQVIKSPTPGVSRFSHCTTTYFYLIEELMDWFDNQKIEYHLFQNVVDGYREFHIDMEEKSALLFKLTWADILERKS